MIEQEIRFLVGADERGQALDALQGLLGDLGQPGADLTDPAGRERRAAMRGSEEDDAADVRHRLEPEDLPHRLALLGAELVALQRLVRDDGPEAVAAGLDHQPREDAAHAVSDQDHLIEGGVLALGIEGLADLEQRVAEHRGREQDGIAGGVEEEPDLIALADLLVAEHPVHHLEPGHRRREQAVDEDERNLLRLVGLQHVQPLLLFELGDVEQVAEGARPRRLVEHVGERRRQVGLQRHGLASDIDALGLERVVDLERAGQPLGPEQRAAEPEEDGAGVRLLDLRQVLLAHAPLLG